MNTVHEIGGFIRFKKKLRRNAFLKSLIFGLSMGLLSASSVILYQKLTTITPALWLYLPVGVGVAAACTLLSYFVLRPSERRIAQKLDDDLALGEKVQTMLAFKNEDSDMLTLQRADTDERLKNASPRAVKYRHAWRNALAPLMAISVLAVATITPIKAVEPPPEEPIPPFELSSWQETALMELIEDVQASDMESMPKEATLHELEVLLAALRVTDTEADMKLLVITVISNLNKIVRDHNSVNTLSVCFAASEHPQIAAVSMAFDMLNGLEAREALDSARETLRVETVAEPLAAFVAALDATLDLSQTTVETTDPLYLAMSELSASLRELTGQLESYTREWAQNQLDTIFKGSSDAVSDALYLQFVNQQVKNDAVTRLMEIFDISADELPDEEKVQLPEEEKPDDEKQDEEEKGNQGAPGEGNVLYGSDDVIYDPVRNEYVKYGEVINEYFAAVSEKIIEGQIPDTLEQFISDYFATLYDGSEKETAE